MTMKMTTVNVHSKRMQKKTRARRSRTDKNDVNSLVKPVKTRRSRQTKASVDDAPQSESQHQPEQLDNDLHDHTELLESSLSNSIRGRERRSQLAREVEDNLAKFPHCILLTRVGQFYEVQ